MSDKLPSEEEWEMEPRQLAALFSEDADSALRLIDCREEEEIAFCRIVKADWIPLSRFAEEAPLRLGGEERPLVLYCHHGMRSLRATQFLRQKGFTRVWSLAGGIERWSLEVDPSVPRY